MKVLISADMEGTAGVSSWVHVTAPEVAHPGRMASQVEYDRARRRMTQEVNAAVEGALKAGAEEVIVNDAHGGMRNLIPEELHTGARFVAGSDKPLVMMQGIEEDIGCVFFTGYHARAGTPGGPLAHTWDLGINDVRVNGTSLGEYGINALVAGHFDVPVALVTGDDKAVAQTQELLGDQVVGVVVKHGYSQTSARHVSTERAQALIRDGAARAVSDIDGMGPYRLPEEAVVEMDFDHQTRAARAAEIPRIEQSAWRTIRFHPSDALDLHSLFRAVARAAETA